MRPGILFLLLLIICPAISAICQQPERKFRIQSGQSVVIACDSSEEQVVHTALNMLCQDYQAVLSASPHLINHPSTEADVIIGTVGKSPLLHKINISLDSLAGKHEAFLLAVIPGQHKNTLLIAGSNKRGTAYGILELSRLLGVSPWEWWADLYPQPLKNFELKNNFRSFQAPDVAYRGIFLNDEDWGLTPWSWQTHEPSDRKGTIGPKTHERIFQLLLRLRANTFWPAMHACSVPFYFTPGNREIADKYGIFIGTSHCEPMMRNTNGEWKQDGQGEYDYVHNRENVLQFWEKRIKEVAGSDNIYTLGMRGVHDGKMQGAKTIQEQKTALTQILADQRAMLSRWVNPEVTQIPQVFIPYKEVLDVYHAGLEVPEDITLMWCDDNYGYIRHFPDSLEKARKGGNGIYYHISYWGRPHDYLWLATTHPALIYNQMQQAYRSGAQKLWIVNVGDIKPAEYLTELFLDIAWNAGSFTSEHLRPHLTNWLQRAFGPDIAHQVSPILQEYYRLAYICKPEFLGNTRVEEKDPKYKIISDLPWSEETIRERLAQYQRLADKIIRLADKIPNERQHAWYQLVEYPVLAANEMNKKLLYAQLARHQKADWELSQNAYDSLVSLTRTYNLSNNGKWNHILNFPRNLPVFQPIPHTKASTPFPSPLTPQLVFNGTEYTSCQGTPRWCGGLGYQGKAILLPKGSSITFRFKLPATDSVLVQTCLVPNHPVNGSNLRYQIKADLEEKQEIAYQTRGRSEEWKQNVLRNQAIRNTYHPLNSVRVHTLTFTALDEGIMIDQIKIFRLNPE